VDVGGEHDLAGAGARLQAGGDIDRVAQRREVDDRRSALPT
jgi:hypothetical protein